MKKTLFIFLLLTMHLSYSQTEEKEEDEKEDIKYELKHKNQPWFKGMKPGADYFKIKKKYDTYFGNHKWEHSRARSTGSSWIKEKIFYLDKNGLVQPQPPFDQSRLNVQTKNSVNAVSTTNLGGWNLVGPVNLDKRKMCGGYVNLNKIDPTNPQNMFVSFITGGLWTTRDGGTNWTLTDAAFPDNKYIDIDVCRAAPLTVYALSTEQLLKSVDGGLNWVATINPSAVGSPYDIAVSPIDPNIVVIRWGGTIYRSTNGGQNWNPVISNLPNYYNLSDFGSTTISEMLDWSTTNTSTVYFISTNNQRTVTVYRSTDSGATFLPMQPVVNTPTITLPTAASGVVAWAKLLLPSNNLNSIYVAIGTGASTYDHHAVQMYKLNAATGTEELKRTNMISGINDTQIHHGDIAMDRVNENRIVYASYGSPNRFYSTNNGASFTRVVGTRSWDIRSIDFINNRVMIGADSESSLSTDGGVTLSGLTNSVSNRELWGFGSAFKTDILAVGLYHGSLEVKEAGAGYDWYTVEGGADVGNTDVNPLDDRYIYSCDQGVNMKYFRTGPATLVAQPNVLDLGSNNTENNYYNSMEFHPNYYYTMITHHTGVYPVGNPNLATWKNSLIKTEDNGNSIAIVKTFNDQVFREKICITNPKHIYVVVGLTNNKLMYSKDAGLTFTDITPTLAQSSNQTNISDIAVSDTDPTRVWVTYSAVQSACKVLTGSIPLLSPAGTPRVWRNLTTPDLTTSPITKIIFQRGSVTRVFVGNKNGIYYKDDADNVWNKLGGNSLPQSDIRFMFINYNQNKLKIGTSRGVFDHILPGAIPPPRAQISASTAKITCTSTDKVQFKDYSTVRNASATWLWSFPGGTPAVSALENPEVSYANAPNGQYDATLTVTDAYGTDTQTITGIVEVLNQCGTSAVETIPGKAATLKGATGQDYLDISNLNLNNNALTFSCWIKPTGIQPDYSAIFMSQDNPNPFGMNFLNGNNTLGFHPNYNWNSGLIAPANKWSHVALVSNGTSVTIYVNGVASSVAGAIPAETITRLFLGTYGKGYTNRITNCQIDEVCIWSRALSTDEVRKWRHLTKSVAGDPIRTGLVAYYQFNEDGGSISLNKVGSDYLSYKGSTFSHDVSSSPVFGGISEKINVTTSGVKNFATTGLSMTFPTGTLPNGDVWVSKSTINPDVLPDALLNFNTYWAVNNYGVNQTFTKLSAIKFTDNALNTSTSEASTYKLFKRTSNDFGATWGAALDTGDSITGIGTSAAITFSTGLTLTSLGQMTLSQNASLTFDPTKEYKIVNRVSGKCIDVPAGSLNDGVGLIQWDYAGNNNQIWKFAAVGGYYKLINKNSNKLINNPASSTADGTIMTQNADTGGTNQQWDVVDLGTGYYKIINNASGKALDNPGSSITNGTDIIQWNYGGGNNQQWQIIEVPNSEARIASELVLGQSEVGQITTSKRPIVHPNPLKSNTPLKITVSAEWDNSTLFVYDATGKQVVNSTLKKGVNEILFNMSPGVYFVDIVNQTDKYSTKLIVK